MRECERFRHYSPCDRTDASVSLRIIIKKNVAIDLVWWLSVRLNDV